MIYSPKQLADFLLLVRQKNRWTQAELAKKVGIKQATISNFENNPDKTTLSTMFKIIQALELKLEVKEPFEVKEPSVDEEDW
ncbi:type II toxin-antitoxin system antitoxin HipB [Vibrio sp. SCSIO 43136]|uniref:type II toxin-antitoxin system antitoxin HipB n=1 Tax=Vibrio sp. SCSIO 43136 TaxID=2819101 RepID=UPI002075608C|nr:type II toxin-antitoxin system antitoxin HipB [Vibrio sp. SCSIO 43136]USD65824.1 type II toxin-antitoxin system antitoxin HipB [Vibrio sp. SCSIO 43136]